jgi:hypothetical protein
MGQAIDEPVRLDKLLDSIVTQTIAKLNGRALPVPQILVREQQAAEILGLEDAKPLQSDRREHNRGQPLKFRYRKMGGRIVYLVSELVEDAQRLPLGSAA